MSELVTIFGSCRQTGIKNYTEVTNILEHLNYPHYTKEILQQIRYLKYKNIPNDLTKYCFRDGLLSQCTREISNDKYEYLKNQFDNTTFFLIEIASMICYKWSNLYMHHIAEEDQYQFYDRHNIKKEDLTHEEIEKDIVQIRNELYPKPFMIISHFATYTKGKRYELIKLLENICTKYNIPFFNQTDIIEKYGIDVILKEPVLAHYNQETLHKVGEFLANKIRDVKNDLNNKKTLYQVYYTSKERVKKNTFHGFGDYIRGCICLYQLYGRKIDLKINFSNHSLSKLFVCDNHISIDESENTKYIFGTGENFLDYIHIFTNNGLIDYNISKDCKEFIVKHCITPTIYFDRKIVEFKNRLNIESYKYSIIHIRLSDNEVFNDNRYNNIVAIIQYIKNVLEPNDKLVLIASSHIYLDKINFPFLVKTNLSRGHVGLDTTSEKECEDTMLEFMAMKTCNKIYQLSVYDWGSGFSDTINKLFDIKVDKYRI
jgi:hypothetical protein